MKVINTLLDLLSLNLALQSFFLSTWCSWSFHSVFSQMLKHTNSYVYAHYNCCCYLSVTCLQRLSQTYDSFYVYATKRKEISDPYLPNCNILFLGFLIYLHIAKRLSVIFFVSFNIQNTQKYMCLFIELLLGWLKKKKKNLTSQESIYLLEVLCAGKIKLECVGLKTMIKSIGKHSYALEMIKDNNLNLSRHARSFLIEKLYKKIRKIWDYFEKLWEICNKKFFSVILINVL